MTQFSFSQCEAVLSQLHRIDWDKRAAFVSRLKHLQKQGVPQRTAAGRGRASSFSFDDLMQIAMALEIIQVGLPPQLAAGLVLRSWDEVNSALSMSLIRDASELEPIADYVSVFRPDVLSEWDGSAENFFESMEVTLSSDLAPRISTHRRLLAVSISGLLREILVVVVEDMRLAQPIELLRDLFSIKDRHYAEIKAAKARLQGTTAWADAQTEVEAFLNDFPAYHGNLNDSLVVGAALLAMIDDREFEALTHILYSGSKVSDFDLQKFIELGLVRSERREYSAVAVAVNTAKATLRDNLWRKLNKSMIGDERVSYVDPEA